MLHLGIGLELSVLRMNQQCSTNRMEEVTLIDRNLNFDFNFQQTVHLPREITVYRYVLCSRLVSQISFFLHVLHIG